MYIVDSYTNLISQALIDVVGGMALNLHPGLLPLGEVPAGK
jgi:methionyl-tRNA formyltransferase